MKRLLAATRERVCQPLGNPCRNVLSAAVHGADRLDDFFRVAVFVEVATGTLAQQGGGVMFFRKAGQDQYRQVGRPRLDSSQRIDSALVRHRDVHQDDIHFPLAHNVQRLTPGGGFCDHLKVNLVGEKLAQSRPHHGMVVNNGNSNHGLASINNADDPTFWSRS